MTKSVGHITYLDEIDSGVFKLQSQAPCSVRLYARVNSAVIANYQILRPGYFPLLITFCQPVLSQQSRKWLNHLSMAPHNLCTSRRKVKVQKWTEEKKVPGRPVQPCKQPLRE